MVNNKNKTKIVATLGPASASKDVLREMLKAGVNVCRINFSHGKHEDHGKLIDIIRELDDELETHTSILADLQGPKIRIGDVENNGIELKNGLIIGITTKQKISDLESLYITYQEFPRDVNPGETILIDDGKLVLEVISTNKKDTVSAKVIHGGMLSSKKGVNLPNTKTSIPCLTEKDLMDLEYAIKKDVSWIGLSFVRKAEDVLMLKELIEAKKSGAKVIAKIEKPEAVENIDSIIEVTDAIMVARGDLGVEIPLQQVPLFQKEIVLKCRTSSKPVIIATQMMESMVTNISPTRAEVNDVANAVLDGADAVMLSGETSVGNFPVKVIEIMSKIVEEVEIRGNIYYKNIKQTPKEDERYITDMVSYGACKLGELSNPKAIVTMTFSGYTAFKLSSYRPNCNIFVFTGNHKILKMLALVWGVKGMYYDKFVSTDHTIDDIRFILKKKGYLVENDLIININSMPIIEKGKSNMLKLSYA
jgi:pyruvate kinase